MRRMESNIHRLRADDELKTCAIKGLCYFNLTEFMELQIFVKWQKKKYFPEIVEFSNHVSSNPTIEFLSLEFIYETTGKPPTSMRNPF